MVLYRKYRPQKLSELDLKTIRERLINILSSKYTPHAFLFSGPKGTGKTSSARIVAKVLNCERRDKNIEPCNSCEACISITEGRNLDVLEIDAASNRGIDEIRELREKIKLTPTSSRYKVYIIDEVHMLTNEAFNALLKILEEPPAHAIFILATTQVEKLPETITSRCVRFYFYKATVEEIVHSLERVVKGEGISVSQDVLFLLSEMADGSFRDATKILEVAVSENALSREKILQTLGRDIFSVEKFLGLLYDKKTKEALRVIYQMGQRGADLRFFTSEILNFLHAFLLSRYDVGEKKISSQLAENFEVKDLNALIRLFSRVYIELKSSSHGELPLEVAVVEWCEEKI